MPASGVRLRGVASLLLVILAVLLTVLGLSRGLWLENVHNALLAVTFISVGAYVLYERPGHREGVLFLATGAVHAVMFYGRQLGNFALEESPLWGWLGVWPLALALALTTFTVICFPDGRLPSRRWRIVAVAIIGDAVVLTVLSALWPVGYEDAGVAMPHPFAESSPAWAEMLWRALAYPSFIALQVLWVVSVVARWRGRDGKVRRQLTWLVVSSSVSVTLLVVGLVFWGSPRAGILSATLLPLSAGWAIVHGQHVAAYSALSWLSTSGADPRGMPDVMARAVGQATDARHVTIWLGDEARLLPVGTWPPTDADLPPTSLAALRAHSPPNVQAVDRNGSTVGAITIERHEPLSRAEQRLFADLGSQAGLLLDHLTLADVIGGEDRAGWSAGLTPRERHVLALIAHGKSNSAICAELHLSVKTVEPIVSTIFTKLGLDSDAGSNRRVLAALEYLRSNSVPDGGDDHATDRQ